MSSYKPFLIQKSSIISLEKSPFSKLEKQKIQQIFIPKEYSIMEEFLKIKLQREKVNKKKALQMQNIMKLLIKETPKPPTLLVVQKMSDLEIRKSQKDPLIIDHPVKLYINEIPPKVEIIKPLENLRLKNPKIVVKVNNRIYSFNITKEPLSISRMKPFSVPRTPRPPLIIKKADLFEIEKKPEPILFIERRPELFIEAILDAPLFFEKLINFEILSKEKPILYSQKLSEFFIESRSKPQLIEQTIEKFIFVPLPKPELIEQKLKNLIFYPKEKIFEEEILIHDLNIIDKKEPFVVQSLEPFIIKPKEKAMFEFQNFEGFIIKAKDKDSLDIIQNNSLCFSPLPTQLIFCKNIEDFSFEPKPKEPLISDNCFLTLLPEKRKYKMQRLKEINISQIPRSPLKLESKALLSIPRSYDMLVVRPTWDNLQIKNYEPIEFLSLQKGGGFISLLTEEINRATKEKIN